MISILYILYACWTTLFSLLLRIRQPSNDFFTAFLLLILCNFAAFFLLQINLPQLLLKTSIYIYHMMNSIKKLKLSRHTEVIIALILMNYIEISLRISFLKKDEKNRFLREKLHFYHAFTGFINIKIPKCQIPNAMAFPSNEHWLFFVVGWWKQNIKNNNLCMEGFLAPPKRTVAHKKFINFQCTAMMVDKNQDEERKKMKNQNEIWEKNQNTHNKIKYFTILPRVSSGLWFLWENIK